MTRSAYHLTDFAELLRDPREYPDLATLDAMIAVRVAAGVPFTPEERAVIATRRAEMGKAEART